jgi:hypothetical protein
MSSANNHCVEYFAFFYTAIGYCLFNADFDDIANAGITPLGAPQHLDTLHPARAAIVRDVEVCLHLNHLFFAF